MKTIFVIALCLLYLGISSRLYSQSINATGSWSVSASGMLTEAGQNYPHAISSTSSQSLVNITGVNPLPSWTVLVHKQDLFWHGSLSVWVRKTGDGSCSGSGCVLSPSGTSPYIQLQNTTQTFFSGARNHNDISIQYEIRGLSVLIPVNDYSTSVIYTLVEL